MNNCPGLSCTLDKLTLSYELIPFVIKSALSFINMVWVLAWYIVFYTLYNFQILCTHTYIILIKYNTMYALMYHITLFLLMGCIIYWWWWHKIVSPGDIAAILVCTHSDVHIVMKSFKMDFSKCSRIIVTHDYSAMQYTHIPVYVWHHHHVQNSKLLHHPKSFLEHLGIPYTCNLLPYYPFKNI
jgi:hypothetical protein